MWATSVISCESYFETGCNCLVSRIFLALCYRTQRKFINAEWWYLDSNRIVRGDISRHFIHTNWTSFVFCVLRTFKRLRFSKGRIGHIELRSQHSEGVCRHHWPWSLSTEWNLLNHIPLIENAMHFYIWAGWLHLLGRRKWRLLFLESESREAWVFFAALNQFDIEMETIQMCYYSKISSLFVWNNFTFGFLACLVPG